MKKAIMFVLVLMNIFGLSGCPADANNEQAYDPYKYNPNQEAIYTEEMLKNILECFDNKDYNTLISMFSEDVKSKYDLKSQIETAFEIYGGKSVSYEGFRNGGYTTQSTKYGICVEKSIEADIKNIKTDNDTVFIISFEQCVIDDDNSRRLGITAIYLRNKDYKQLSIIGNP